MISVKWRVWSSEICSIELFDTVMTENYWVDAHKNLHVRMKRDYFGAGFTWLASVAVKVIRRPVAGSTGRAGVAGGRMGGSASWRLPRSLRSAVATCDFKLLVDRECSRLETLHAFFLALFFLSRLSLASCLPTRAGALFS